MVLADCEYALVHDLQMCGCCTGLDHGPEMCRVLRTEAADVVRRREVGRKRGAAVAQIMRRTRSALEGAIDAV